jgi:hypothetical protein
LSPGDPVLPKLRILMSSGLGSRHRSDGVYEHRPTPPHSGPAVKEEPKGNGVLFRRIWPTECQGLCASIRRSSGVEASLHSRTSKFPTRPVSQDRVHFSDGSAFTLYTITAIFCGCISMDGLCIEHMRQSSDLWPSMEELLSRHVTTIKRPPVATNS